MSRLRMLDQERASAAWEAIRAVKDKKDYEKEYGQLARRAAAEVQTSGLGQALSFWRAKGSKEGVPKDGGQNAHWKLQEHVSTWVMGQLQATHSDGLMGWIMDNNTSSDQYRRATAEAMAFLIWLKRFAEAKLGGD